MDKSVLKVNVQEILLGPGIVSQPIRGYMQRGINSVEVRINTGLSVHLKNDGTYIITLY